MTVEQARGVVTDHPLVHRTRDGAPKDGGLTPRLAERFIEELSALSKPRIVETGSGLSTLVFLALDPGSVITISPAPELHERIRAEATARGIDLTPARFVDDRSEAALPLLALVEGLEIDAAFIDGNHGWPAVFVDFCYLNRMLRPGGLMFVDDVQVYAVAQLVCLLPRAAAALRVRRPRREDGDVPQGRRSPVAPRLADGAVRRHEHPDRIAARPRTSRVRLRVAKDRSSVLRRVLRPRSSTP